MKLWISVDISKDKGQLMIFRAKELFRAMLGER